MRPRLHEVARLAGVSEATVSRVLNGKRGVADDTRATVLRALGDLGYDESHVPAVSRATVVGIISPELDNPIFPALAQAVEERLARLGYTAVLGTATTDTAQEGDLIELLVGRGVAGMVCVSGRHADTSADQSLYALLVEKQIPVVFVNGAASVPGIPSVSCDERAAARLAVEHLVALGHRKIGCVVGPRRYVPSQAKTEGYLRAMKDALGWADESLVIESVFTVEGGHAGAAPLLERGVTAIVAGSDLMALGVIRAARDWSRRVPEDVAVVGYDGTPLTAFFDPALTTVRQPVRAMGARVAETLVDGINGLPHAAPPHSYLFAPELVVRRSTGPPPKRS
ncbi:MAG: LacI family DNA-binding transcriptional regulator [Acidimicrobiales bacterium]